jgi:GNAT superfamily N-acetyltransferase
MCTPKISLDHYLRDPCRTLSIPYFKYLRNPNPSHVLIQHQSELNLNNTSKKETFFRLIHHLKSPIILEKFVEIQEVDSTCDIQEIIDFINSCYIDLKVNETYIRHLVNDCTYRKDLWIWLIDEGQRVALALNAYDDIAKEGTLEWIQVKSEYRRKGYGLEIILHSLQRLRKYANFVTVSGKVDNKTKPEMVYRKAGFVGDDLWYIQYLSKEKEHKK